MKRVLRLAIPAVAAFALVVGPASRTEASEPVPLDAFESTGGWSAHPADGVELKLSSDKGLHGNALRMDFKFPGGAGYAVAHKAFDLDLPENYAFTFEVKGDTPPQSLEFKLIDSTGANVWWYVRRDFDFPKDWTRLTTKKRHFRFAWGPAGGGEIHHVAAIEIVVTAGSGQSGTVWVDDLELRALPPPDANPPAPAATASGARPGFGAARAVDGDSTTAWRSAAGDKSPWLALDLGEEREFGGVVLDWEPGRRPSDYVVEGREEGGDWRALYAVREGAGGIDHLYLPESEARALRLRVTSPPGAGGIGLGEIRVEPVAWSASRESFYAAVAADARRGAYPRGMSGEQSYWTVAGVDGDTREVLVNEDGAVGTGEGSFSLEPFLYVRGRPTVRTRGSLHTWADVAETQSLVDGYLPMPEVTWTAGKVELKITAFGTGAPESSSVVVRYQMVNRGDSLAAGALYVAARPFQVNPPTQTLNHPGGFAPVRTVSGAGGVMRVNGVVRAYAPTHPTGFGALAFDQGGLVEGYLERGKLPPHAAVADSQHAASGVWEFAFALRPNAGQDVTVVIPLHDASPGPPLDNDKFARLYAAGTFGRARSDWERRLGTVGIGLPASAALLDQTLRAQLGYILVDRAGPALQPGARAYARSWIRDGSMTSSALLRLGQDEVVKDFITWFAPHQFASGKVPCVVDRRGADPVPEHDSSGEFIFLVADYLRYTGDLELAGEMYPRVLRAVAYLDSLRHQRLTPAFDSGDSLVFRGLLPPSISHEGYSAQPMHSYWDDFWAYRGFGDAAYLAGMLGHPDEAARLDTLQARFGRDVRASVELAMKRHGIPYVPGCADLGDFDATSTTVALDPTGAAAVLPAAAVDSTFERYWTFFKDRAQGKPWDAFTPYELRNVGAFVRLGRRDRVGDLLTWFFTYQRPLGWREWAEVVESDVRKPRFLGDMPHTWVGSDYIRSVLDMFAYVREGDSTLVIGAGVLPWWVDRDPGVTVTGLRTPYGPLSYAMQKDGKATVVTLEGGITPPPGGFVIVPPAVVGFRHVTVDGKPAVPGPGGGVAVSEAPATVRFAP